MTVSIPQANMVRNQVHTWEVVDHDLLQLMASVPRSHFVDPEYAGVACVDARIKALNGADMLPAAEIGRILTRVKTQTTDSVAIVGAESGYLVALLAQVAHHVTWFLPQSLHEKTPAIEGVTLIDFSADTAFWQDGPFDIIIMAEAVQLLPDNWRDGLTKEGRMWFVQGDSRQLQTAWLMDSEGLHSQYETSWSWLDGFAPEETFVF